MQPVLYGEEGMLHAASVMVRRGHCMQPKEGTLHAASVG
jgi:hypothetical protein